MHSRSDKLFVRAEEQRAKGLHQEALKTYEKIIALDEKSPAAKRAYLEIGNVYYHGMRDYKSAEKVYGDFSRSGVEGEETYEARVKLSEIYRLHYRDYRRAIVEYQNIIRNYFSQKNVAPFQMAAADHIGAALGAIATALVWLPLTGVTCTCVLLCILKTAAFMGNFAKSAAGS